MLTSWRIKNFKAWQDTGPLRLAPLTVIFGANSMGKSSLLQPLLALKQTAQSEQAQQPLDLGHTQSLIDLGSFAQCLHQGQLSEPLDFALQWQLAEELALHDVGQQSTVLVDELGFQVSFIADQKCLPQLQSLRYSAYRQSDEIFNVSYCSTRAKVLHVEIKKPQLFTYSVALKGALNSLRFEQLAEQINTPFIVTLAQQTASVFASFHSLAALRALAQRRYHWRGEHPASVGATGKACVAAILAANAQQRLLQFTAEQVEQTFTDAVTYWLKQLGVATDFAVRPLTKSADAYQVLLKTYAEADETNLADLGFGVAQLLPLVVQAFYAQRNSTLWLEQPETHLHPQVQASMADMLIAATQASENGEARNVQIIVESHSEHFLNRLQRRIAEGVISHNDVALYFCSRDGKQTKIEALSVDTYGEIANWPEHLFGDEMTDIAARAMAAVQRKRQQQTTGSDDA